MKRFLVLAGLMAMGLASLASDNLVLDFAGAKASSFSPEERSRLIELIGLYVGNMREAHAKVRMTEVVAHLDDTRFAWVGSTLRS